MREVKRWLFGGGLLALALTGGCAGHGTECSEDEAGDSIEVAQAMGTLHLRPLLPEGQLVAEGILQTAEDEDWYRFMVTDPWAVRWHPRIRLSVFAEAGTGHTADSYSVEVYNHAGEYVATLGEASLRLSGTPFYDDGLPYYLRVRWRNPGSFFEDTPTPADGGTPTGPDALAEVSAGRATPTPGTTGDPTASESPTATASAAESPSPSTSAEATPSAGASHPPGTPRPPGGLTPTPDDHTPPTPGLEDDGDDGAPLLTRCSRYVIRVDN